MSLVASKNIVLPLQTESKYQTDSMTMDETASPSGALIVDSLTRQDSMTLDELKSLMDAISNADLMGMSESKQLSDVIYRLELLSMLEAFSAKLNDLANLRDRKRKGWDIVWGSRVTWDLTWRTKKDWLEE